MMSLHAEAVGEEERGGASDEPADSELVFQTHLMKVLVACRNVFLGLSRGLWVPLLGSVWLSVSFPSIYSFCLYPHRMQIYLSLYVVSLLPRCNLLWVSKNLVGRGEGALPHSDSSPGVFTYLVSLQCLFSLVP